ncbi:MAG: hypothetical protein UE068_02060 [Paludibacteraceae bacterium]|nr:hypothetical protein [Paludibacteraceae bacterium]
MKRIILFILSMLAFISVEAKTVFEIDGPERSYNQITVINRTSQDNFSCRLVLLTENLNGSLHRDEEYGTYHFKGENDEQTITVKIKRGTLVGIEFEENFPVDVDVTVDYRDNRFFDSIVVVLADKNKKYESF